MVKKHLDGSVSEKRKVRLEPWMNIPWLLTRRQERPPPRHLHRTPNNPWQMGTPHCQ